MSPSRIRVDFNEMPSPDEVLLSREDRTRDSNGEIALLWEGLGVTVFEDDIDVLGRPDALVADGGVVLNTHDGWASSARWLLKIGARGIRHESEDGC